MNEEVNWSIVPVMDLARSDKLRGFETVELQVVKTIA